jgi:hypothetical protein
MVRGEYFSKLTGRPLRRLRFVQPIVPIESEAPEPPAPSPEVWNVGDDAIGVQQGVQQNEEDSEESEDAQQQEDNSSGEYSSVPTTNILSLYLNFDCLQIQSSTSKEASTPPPTQTF